MAKLATALIPALHRDLLVPTDIGLQATDYIVILAYLALDPSSSVTTSNQ